MKKNVVYLIALFTLITHACTKEREIQLLAQFVEDSYKYAGVQALEYDPEFAKKVEKRGRRRVKTSEVPVNHEALEPELPTWITEKQYVTSNIDAIKYKPSVLIGSIVRKYDDGTFEVFTASNIRKGEVVPELEIVEKPLNCYEKTFSSGAVVNASFVVGSLSIQSDEALKITYTETSYLIAENTDDEKKEKYKAEILSNPVAKKWDWAFVRGITTLDCSYSKFKNQGGVVSANASFVSVGTELYQKDGETNNFRLISVDIEPLWLN